LKRAALPDVRHRNRDVGARTLCEVEAVGEIVGARIACGKGRDAEVLFSEVEDAAELVLDVRNVNLASRRVR